MGFQTQTHTLNIVSRQAVVLRTMICIFSIMGIVFRNRLKFVWAQIFNIWDSEDEHLMPFDIIWHHSALLDAIRHYLDAIRHYQTLFRHYQTLLEHYLDTIGHYQATFRHYQDTIRSKANLKYVPIVENVKMCSCFVCFLGQL